MAAQPEKNIFKQRFPEEDDQEEEGNSLADRRTKAAAQGMVEFNNWEEEITTMLTGVIDSSLIPAAFEAIKKAAKATCLVHRLKSSEKRKDYYEKEVVLQGISSGFDIMYLALADRNMQVRFSLKVIWES